MNKRLSVYLNLLRLFAAALVVAQHVGTFLLFKLHSHMAGAEAVIIFFVLSGFVISYVTTEREQEWRGYAIARASRMYSVVPLAFLTTIAADAIGRHVAEAWYIQHFYSPFHPLGDLGDVLRGLTFTNELWYSHSVVGTNEPYWSLGFEVPYYLLFGLVLFVPRLPVKIGAVLLWAMLAGPKIVVFLPLWLSGVMAYRVIRVRPRLPPTAAIGLAVATALAAVLPVWRSSTGEAIFHWWGTPEEIRVVAYSYTLAALFAVHLVAFDAVPGQLSGALTKLEAPIRWLADGSFSLYILHMPILACFAAIAAATHAGVAVKLLLAIVVVLLCYGLAELGERRKKQIAGIARRGVAWAIGPFDAVTAGRRTR